MHDITIATPFVRQACIGVQDSGYHLDAILQSCGIKPWMLHSDRMRVPAESFVLLLQKLMRLTDDECIGLLDRPQRLGCFALIARSSIHERRLIDAMQHFVRAANLLQTGLIHQLDVEGDRIKYSLRLSEGAQLRSNYLLESTVMTSHRFFCWLGNVRIPIRQVELDYPAPTWASEYRFLFYGAPVRFDAAQTRIEMQLRDQDSLVRKGLDELTDYLDAAPKDIFTPLSARQTSHRAREVLLQRLQSNHDMLTSKACAQALSLSPQTFWRKLQREGTDFTQLRGAVRRDLAMRLLSQGQSVEEIATLTGYAESSSFIRAFKQWTGLTPLAYQKMDSPPKPAKQMPANAFHL
ncbi:MAG: AraC family transcriptional regulator [Oceanococcus sp.]